MPPKRRRACETCHAAKIRCELSVLGSLARPPCRRCKNTGKECFLAAPRLQRNRIAELEAQVDALTEALREQQSTVPYPTQYSETTGSEDRPLTSSGVASEDDNKHAKERALFEFASNVSAVSCIVRRADSNPWTNYHDEHLDQMRDSDGSSSAELELWQIVDAERLCHLVACRMGLCDASTPPTQYEMQGRISSLSREIEKWSARALILKEAKPLLHFYKYIAILYLNEATLHTTTNKSTFGAPFVPDHIAPADFAAPLVTIDHISSLYAIKDSCHAALDVALKMDMTSTLPSLPSSFPPRVLYALFVLLKLYVSITAPGNTYGSVLDHTELQLESYFERFRSQANEHAQTPTCASMIFANITWLENWYSGYKAIAEEYQRRMSLQLVWTPATSNSGQQFGLDLQAEDYAIRPSDLVWMDNGYDRTLGDPIGEPKQYTWRSSGMGRIEPCNQDFM